MSDDAEASTSSDYQLMEYKDGQLQIVEVTPFDRQESTTESHILPDVLDDDSGHHKVMQILDSDKGLVHLDLLNLTLVRCEDNEEAYRLISNSESDSEANDGIACVLQTSDGEGDNDNREYVMMGGEQVPLVFLTQSDQTYVHYDRGDRIQRSQERENNTNENDTSGQSHTSGNNTKILTPAEIIEKVKLMQKSRALPPCPPPGRKRPGLPPPRQLLAEPNLKLFLYSCKLCQFKCNAVKELTKHRATEHAGRNKARIAPRNMNVMQCANCPFTGNSVSQLMSHVEEKHNNEETEKDKDTDADYAIECAVDVLVCGACGFESMSSHDFKRHLERSHGTTVKSASVQNAFS